MKRALACAFQTAAVSQLEEKLLLALKWCEMNGITIQEIVVSGGVASNEFLRERYIMFQAMKILFKHNFFRLRQCLLSLTSNTPPSLVFPPPYLCTGQSQESSNQVDDELIYIYMAADNAVMIGWASMHRFLANDTDQYDLDLRPKWSIEKLMN